MAMDSCTYPAYVGVQESPPNAILSDLLHSTTSVQENSQHTLAQVDNGRILLGFGRFGSVICHSVFLWDGWDNKGRMEVGQGLS